MDGPAPATTSQTEYRSFPDNKYLTYNCIQLININSLSVVAMKGAERAVRIGRLIWVMECAIAVACKLVVGICASPSVDRAVRLCQAASRIKAADAVSHRVGRVSVITPEHSDTALSICVNRTSQNENGRKQVCVLGSHGCNGEVLNHCAVNTAEEAFISSCLQTRL